MPDIQFIECDELPKMSYPDIWQCYLRKECIGYQAWEYGNSSSIDDIWDNDYIDDIDSNHIVCGMFICKDCIILVTHGGDDGSIKRYDLLLSILTDPIYAGISIYIQCCHPYYISQVYPELRPYLLNNSHKLSCGIRMNIKNPYIELFIERINKNG